MLKAILRGDHGTESQEIPLAQVKIQNEMSLEKGEKIYVLPSYRMILDVQTLPNGDVEVVYENCFIIAEAGKEFLLTRGFSVLVGTTTRSATFMQPPTSGSDLVVTKTPLLTRRIQAVTIHPSGDIEVRI